MRKIDAVLFDGEFDMLAVRMAELASSVDVFLVVEANRTHQGDPRDLAMIPDAVMALARMCYRWNPMICVAPYTVDLSEYDGRGRGGAGQPDYQVRERAHRDGVAQAVLRSGVEAQPGDVVWVSDVDEIPSASTVRERVPAMGQVLVAEQRMHCFALDWQYPGPWLGSMAVRLGGDPTTIEWPLSPQAMRDARGTDRVDVVRDAGWHLTWMGGPTMNERKQHRFSHAELNGRTADLFAEHREHGIDSNGVQCHRVVVDTLSWPTTLLGRARMEPTKWRTP